MQASPTASPATAPRHPTLELLARYQTVLQAAWTHRAELAGPQRLADELAFLPAALSLQETPLHPAPCRLAWGLMGSLQAGAATQAQLQSEWQDIQAKLAKFQAEASRRQAEIGTVHESIANQDIGFVNAGQSAQVKLETFAYTKYGTVSATVEVVTADAVTDEKKGSYYPATLTLHAKDMLIDGKRVNISPGMNVTAEIETGQRRVIEYLLSSVQRAGSESLRER